ERVPRLDVLGEDEHTGVRKALADLPRRSQALIRVRRWHADVDDRDLRLVHADVAQQILGVPGLRDDLEPRLAEEARDALAQEHRAVGEDYGDRVPEGRDGLPQRREVAR